jgi:hypothetical protein
MTIFNDYCVECGKYTASWVEGTEVIETDTNLIVDGKVRSNKRLVCGECVKKRKKENG